MTSQQWAMGKWGALAVVVALMFYLGVVGATMGTFIVLALVMLAGVGAWKDADKRESEAKAQELRGR